MKLTSVKYYIGRPASKDNDSNFIKSIKEIYFEQYESRLRWAKETKQTEEQFYPRNGIATHEIAKKFDTDCSTIRPLLNRMAKKGIILKSSSVGSMAVWWPIGFLEEIKSTI